MLMGLVYRTCRFYILDIQLRANHIVPAVLLHVVKDVERFGVADDGQKRFLVEGDTGILTYQGYRVLDFRRF